MRPRLSLQCVAFPDSRFPKLLLYAFPSSLSESVLVLLHAEQLHQLPWNLGNRRYPVSPGSSCHSRLIKAKPNIVGLSLGKPFACCEENKFFSQSHHNCILSKWYGTWLKIDIYGRSGWTDLWENMGESDYKPKRIYSVSYPINPVISWQQLLNRWVQADLFWPSLYKMGAQSEHVQFLLWFPILLKEIRHFDCGREV